MTAAAWKEKLEFALSMDGLGEPATDWGVLTAVAILCECIAERRTAPPLIDQFVAAKEKQIERAKALAIIEARYDETHGTGTTLHPTTLPADDWFSVTEAMPELDEEVLIVYETQDGKRKRGLATWTRKSTVLPFWAGVKKSEDVLYWMRVPEIPEPGD